MKGTAGTRADGFSIGALSKRTGCNVETIRFYEKEGLIAPPPRTAGGHRVYGASHLRRLGFVRRSRELGFTLGEVRALLELVDGRRTCGEVRAVALDHIESIRRKIADLQRLDRALSEVAARCAGGDDPVCPIVEALFS